jgi:hypothetical protein
MQQGLNCDVVNDRDGCYNPFFVTDPANLTSVAVLEAVAARDAEWTSDELNTFDLVLNGEIPLGGFELPGGPIGAAIGYQRREDWFENVPAQVELAGDTWIGGTEKEVVTNGDRSVDAYFAELSVPVLDTLELNLAVRNEKFSTGQSSTDPKYGVTWAATEWLTLRGTTGDAFIAPTLGQLYNPVSCGLSSVTDRFGPFSAFTTNCNGGNPLLKNETATSDSLGFDLNFNDFDFHLTYNKTDFKNRIVTTTGQQIMEIEFFNFKQWSGFTGTGGPGDRPSLAQLQGWLASGQNDKTIIRSPDDIYDILQVSTGSGNASSVIVEAYDIQTGYSFSLNDIGDFSINLQATYIDSFKYQEDPTKPVVEAAGNFNYRTGTSPALPQWKGTLRLNWTKGNHYVAANVHYTDAMTYDGPDRSPGILSAFGNTYQDLSILTEGVHAWSDLDLAYTYRGLELMDGQLSFSIGSRNVFDREAQRSAQFAGVLGELQDPMGRSLYARVVYDF